MFIHKLNQVTEQTSKDCQSSKYIDDYLFHAVSIWCKQLAISQDTTNYILVGYRQQEIRKLTNYIFQEGTTEKRDIRIPTPLGEKSTGFTVENPFFKYVNALFYRMNITSGSVEFIAIIAFIITSVGFWLYKINQERQQQTSCKEEPRQSSSNPPSFTVQPTRIQLSPVQTITKQFLVLVVSATQGDFLESLQAKSRINSNEGESLYEITKYLWLGSETDFNQRTNDINRYSVSKREESEYDIYLVYIELNQSDEGFKPNVDQLDRYDAFRKLADLGVELKVSPRLRMEAYGNIDVYNR